MSVIADSTTPVIFKTIEDFKFADAEKLRDDHEFHEWLSEQFKTAWTVHLNTVIPEVNYNLNKFDNAVVEDYFDESDGSMEDNKHLFSGAMIPEKVRRLVSFLVKENPKPEIDPHMREGYEMMVARAFPFWPDWTKREIMESGGAEFNPETEEIEFTNPEGFKDWFNKLIDNNWGAWWKYGNMSRLKYILAKWAILAHEAYIQLRIVDFPENTRIIAEHIKSQNLLKDPIATTLHERRIFFHIKPVLISDVAQEYGIDKKRLKPASGFSEMMDNITAETPEDAKYKFAQVIVAQAFFKDMRKINVGAEDNFEEVLAYPNGRIITFVPDQDTKTGILILDDGANIFSSFPILELILDPTDELHGRPLVRDIINIANLANEVMQQGIANLRAMGNSKIIYEEGAFVDEDEVSNIIAEKIQVTGGVESIKFMPPPAAITGEAQTLYAFFEQMARQATGVDEIAEGKRPGDIISGKALQILQSAVSQLMQLSVNAYADCLTRIATLWLSMAPYVYTKGKRIVTGATLKESHEMPFNLGDFLAGGEIFISPDTIMPRDDVSRKNLVIALAGMTAEDGGPYLPRKYVLKKLDMEDLPEAMKDIQEAGDMQQRLQQAEQALEQADQQLEEAGKEIDKANQERDSAVEKIKGQVVSGQFTLEEQRRKDDGMNLRAELDGKIAVLNKRIDQQTKIIVEQIKSSNRSTDKNKD